MRISDWSSDVCSSDLDPPVIVSDGIEAAAGEERGVAMIIAREHTGRGVDDNETPADALQEMPGEEHAIRAPQLQRLRHWARAIRSVCFMVVVGTPLLHALSSFDLSNLLSFYQLEQ